MFSPALLVARAVALLVLAALSAGARFTRWLRVGEIRRGAYLPELLKGDLEIALQDGGADAISARVGATRSATGRTVNLHLDYVPRRRAVLELTLWRDGTRAGSQAAPLLGLALDERPNGEPVPLRLGAGGANASVTLLYRRSRGDATGFVYESWVPSLNLGVPYPKIALPLPSHRLMSQLELLAMGASMALWRLFGEAVVRRAFPDVRAAARAADPESDAFFVERRLNGWNPGFLVRVHDQPWHYESRIEMPWERRPEMVLPRRAVARFALEAGALRCHSILLRWSEDGPDEVVHPGEPTWADAKQVFLTTEVNHHSSAVHTAVHYEAEQYAMALYRNLAQNPVRRLLEPHVFETVYTSREIVRPREATEFGVVTIAYALTLAGQKASIRDYLASLDWRQAPAPYPDAIAGHVYDEAQLAMWEACGEHVGAFFARHRAAIERHWDEVRGFSDDLVGHAVDPRRMAPVTTLAELEQLCRFVIFRTTFYHGWIHFKDRQDPDLLRGVRFADWVRPDQRAALLDTGRKIQWFVTYFSHFKRQFPLTDAAVGAADTLREAVLRRADRITPGLPLDELTLTPNT